MKLYYYRAAQGNFGDDLNSWLWEELAPGRWSDEDDGELFCGIGTIIGNDMPQAKRIRVFSSGIGYRPVPADFNSERWNVTALRGPLTAQVVGRPELAVADGALLLSTLPRLRPLAAEERHGTILIPHYEAMDEGPWATACRLAGVELVDPRQCGHRVIERIRRARLVIADSMHAAIIADTMRVPWVPVASSRRINSFKWLDWTLSLDLPYEPIVLPSISLGAYYEGQVQRCTGQDFRLPRPDRESAMAHYRRMMRREGNRLWQSVRPKLRHHLRALPGRLPAQAAARDAMARWDRRRTERMAMVLHQLDSAPAFMSGDMIFQQRVEQLSSALNGIPRGR
jgi:succinoglycan biosynthesis protein ExoV